MAAQLLFQRHHYFLRLAGFPSPAATDWPCDSAIVPVTVPRCADGG
jgi:hypothetical protein